LKYQSEDGVNIEVKQVPKGRGHAYKVTVDPVGPENPAIYTAELPSVTTILRQSDGSAVDPISRWSVKQALDSMQWVMHEEEEPYITEKNLEVAKKAPMVELKKAGDRGTALHKAMEMYFSKEAILTQEIVEHLHKEGFETIAIDKALNCLGEIFTWIGKLGYKVVATELPVYDKNLQVAGTIDMLLSNNKDTVYICDLKTGKNIYKKDGMQVGAYLSSVVNMLGDGLRLWEPFPDELPTGDRITSLNVGGAVIHMDVEKETVKIHHINDEMIGNVGFMSAKKLYDMNKKSKFQVEKL
tara:strand:- start:2353 stop:3246 length:894 start_codon:yes stop_codon:yes gene_type:complete